MSQAVPSTISVGNYIPWQTPVVLFRAAGLTTRPLEEASTPQSENHWQLHVLLSNQMCVLFDIQKDSESSMGRLYIMTCPYNPLDSVIQQFLAPATAGTTVLHVYSYLVGANMHQFMFVEGRCGRLWL